MRLRGPFVTIGAIGLAVLAVGLIAVLTSINRQFSDAASGSEFACR
jgi:uncharacterized protein YoxC